MLTGTPHNIPLIIGHRGASRDALENTLESFRLACWLRQRLAESSTP